MKKTIELTPKSTKWIFIFNGIVNTFVGINTLLLGDGLNHWIFLALAILLIVAGPLFFIYGIILFNPYGKIAPRVHIDEKVILIKSDLHKRAHSIHWNTIKEITYKSFELDFLLVDNKSEKITLPTSATISINIKKAIREFAGAKQINIIGG